MANTLKDVLASPGQLTVTEGLDQQANAPGYYRTDQLWAVAAMVLMQVEGAQIYDGRDPNQQYFISTKDPNGPRRRNRRGPRETGVQVTGYKSGTVTFNNVAVIDKSAITPKEMAAGQLLAHKLGVIELSEEEQKAFAKEAGL